MSAERDEPCGCCMIDTRLRILFVSATRVRLITTLVHSRYLARRDVGVYGNTNFVLSRKGRTKNDRHDRIMILIGFAFRKIRETQILSFVMSVCTPVGRHGSTPSTPPTGRNFMRFDI